MKQLNPYRLIRWILGFVVCGVLTYAFMHYLAHEKINRAIRETIRGIESSDRGLTMSQISETYHDAHGYTRHDIDTIAQQAFGEFKDIRVHIISRDLQKKMDSATMILEIKVVADYGPQRGYVVGSPQEARRVEVSLKKETEGWRIVSVTGLN